MKIGPIALFVFLLMLPAASFSEELICPEDQEVRLQLNQFARFTSGADNITLGYAGAYAWSP